MEQLVFPRLTRDIDMEGLATYAGYRRWGGYRALERAMTMEPADITAEVKASGLNGRGGAGFNAGMKWGFLPANKFPRYLVVNCDESEPGTYKDRWLLERNPHLLIEGTLITARAVTAAQAFIYVRGEYDAVSSLLESAIEEARAANLVGQNILGTGWDFEITIHKGAGAYVCGEENALLESLAGNRGRPRPKPPYFPAAIGLYDAPTVLNNVETIATVPIILTEGPEEFRSVGTEKSPGTRLICVSGHVKSPGVFEVRHDISVTAIIEDLCGGMLPGRELKAVQPGGSSSPILTAEEASRCRLDIESLRSFGAAVPGTGGVIAIAQDQCMVEYASRLADFYYRESCGKCTPCREGTFWLSRIFRRIESGAGRLEDVELIKDVCGGIDGKVLCGLGDGAIVPLRSAVNRFEAEFLQHIEQKGCPFKSAAADLAPAASQG